MKFRILLLASLLACLPLSAQNPGNVGLTNLTGWFLPDNLPLGNVTAWTTTYSTLGNFTVSDNAAPYPVATNTPPNNVSNYNTTLDFTSTNSLTNLRALENTGAFNLMQNNGGNNQGSFFCAYYQPNSNPNNHLLLYNNSPHAIQFRLLNATGRIAIGLSPTNSTNASRDWAEDFVPTIISYTGSRQTTTSMLALERGVPFNTAVASQSSGPQGIYMGVQPGNGNSPYKGYIHEYIFYDRTLTNLEVMKVNTYLAIKYGVTLDRTGGGTYGDYVATNGALIWDASANPAYHNNVIGIGRDDSEGLYQRQSHSFDDAYRIYISNLSPTNVANTGTFSDDTSYVVFGHRLGANCGSGTSNNESPANVQSRIAKEWRATKTNFSDIFNWDLKIDTCNINGYQNGPIDPNNFVLLVDNDGDFQDATTFSSLDGLTFSFSNSYLTVAGISNVHFPNNTSQYFTVGYNTVLPSISGDTAICEGDSTFLQFQVQYANGPVDFDVVYNTDTLHLTNISDGDSLWVYPTQTTSYTVSGSRNFMDCCGGTPSSSALVTVHPNPVLSIQAQPSELCVGDSTQITASGADSYQWTPNFTNGTYIHPTSTAQYHVVGTTNEGCSSEDSITIPVYNLPNVEAFADTLSLCLQDSIQAWATGADTYNWSNSINNYDYFHPNMTQTIYVLGTDTNACVSLDSLEITVYDLPQVVANASSLGICEGDQLTLYGSGAQTYAWQPASVTDNLPFTPTQSDLYTVTGTDQNNCQERDSIFVDFYPIVPFSLPADTNICPQNPITLAPNTQFSAYYWSNGAYSYSIQVNTEDSISLTVTDQNGCTYTDHILIGLRNDCFPTLYIPTAFTPDGDEHNPIFNVKGSDLYSYQMQIFNRWGELLFVTEDLNIGWDGTYLGKLCPQGMYTYVVQYSYVQEIGETKVVRGHFNLLR